MIPVRFLVLERNRRPTDGVQIRHVGGGRETLWVEWWEDLNITNESVSIGNTIHEADSRLTPKLREECP